mgnify:CR=1 FL=1
MSNIKHFLKDLQEYNEDLQDCEEYYYYSVQIEQTMLELIEPDFTLSTRNHS